MIIYHKSWFFRTSSFIGLALCQKVFRSDRYFSRIWNEVYRPIWLYLRHYVLYCVNWCTSTVCAVLYCPVLYSTSTILCCTLMLFTALHRTSIYCPLVFKFIELCLVRFIIVFRHLKNVRNTWIKIQNLLLNLVTVNIWFSGTPCVVLLAIIFNKENILTKWYKNTWKN